MNIEYTENTKYVEDIVRKYITDPEDCDTVIWCLQKMHIDIDSLVAMLKRKDQYIDDKHKELTKRFKKICELLKQNKEYEAMLSANSTLSKEHTEIILDYDKLQSRFRLPFNIYFTNGRFGIQENDFSRSYCCSEGVTSVHFPNGDFGLVFSNETDYMHVKIICEDVTEIAKQREAAINE